MEQKKKCCQEQEELVKKKEQEREEREKFTVGDLKSLTPYQRALAGKTTNSLERQKHILTLQNEQAFDEFAPDFIFELDPNKPGGRAMQIEASATLNERYYQFLMQKMKKVGQKFEDIKIEEMYDLESCSSRKGDNVKLKEKLISKVGNYINPLHIVEQLKESKSDS